MKNVIALIAGIVFGLGLSVSQMTNPYKVLSFLNVLGSWDPSLALVMGAALVVSLLGFIVSKRLKKPLVGSAFHIPTQKLISKPLIIGAILFGIGWGVAGLCPGPAIASLAAPSQELLTFLVSMVIGMIIAKRVTRP